MKGKSGSKNMKNPREIFSEMQELKTREEAITYLRNLPKLDDPWPEDASQES